MAYTPEDHIDDTPVATEMETSFLSYAMSVIVSRALPDVRDGLKPVHRRILYSMEDLNLGPTVSHVKSARVVGDCIGRFHPHGDVAVYQAMVRMSQDFSMGLPLVDGHGNFGTHSDPAAAARYCVTGDTRIRLADGTTTAIRNLAPGATANSDTDIDATVLDWHGKPVQASKFFHSGVHPVKKVTLRGGLSLRGSHNHLVLGRQPTDGASEFVWKRLEELSPGDVLALAALSSPSTPTAAADEAVAKKLGVELLTWTELSPWFLALEPAVKRAALATALLADGGQFRPQTLRDLPSALASDLQELLLEFGIYATLTAAAGSGHVADLNVDAADVSAIESFRDGHQAALPGAYRFDEVLSVVDEEPQDVYSVRVDTEDHSFLAGGFINHNTEARMSHAAAVMTADIDENTVDMRPNYDGKILEPSVLPAGFPNLLVNGGEGIAVGMATKMPPHNLGETVKGAQHLLAHPDATVEDLIKIIPAPDLPTGGLILDVGGAQDAYRTGRGKFRMRARTEVSGREIVVTELPYQVGPEKVIEAIKKAKDMGKLDEVASVVDLSDRNHGMRLTITVKRNARGIPVNPDAVLRKLFKVSPLEESFSIHNLALVDGAPRTLTLLQMLTHYVNHRLDVTRRRCEFRKAKAESRAHLLEGFLVALENIDAIVELIRSSRDTDSARNKLMKSYKLSEIQATSILEMPLRRLTSLEVKKIKDELAELVKKIAELVRLLSDDNAMRKLVSDELASNSAKFTVPRRSTITNLTVEDTAVDDVDSVEIEDVMVRLSLTTTGKIGRFDTVPHKGARTKDDLLVTSIDCSVRALVGAVTNTGRLLHLHPIDIPACEGKDKGIKLEDALPELARGERVIGLVDAGPESRMVVLATREGFVKRMAGKDMPKKDGQEIIGFKSDTDEVVAVDTLPLDTEDTADIVLVTTNAQLLKFTASSVRPQGRTGAGVAGIKLTDGAHVLTMTAVPAGAADQVVLTLTDGGSGKWTPLADYPAKGRAGAGVRCMKMLRTETGLVAARVGTLASIAGVAASGAATRLPVAAARRDASGEKVEFVTLAGHRP